MASSVVFKARYGETLRRFRVSVEGVAGDRFLGISMKGLRVKISSFFNFPSDADFTLTYLDEDDDEVTLVDDEDLHDVWRQGLDPVRVTVILNANNDASIRTQPCENSNTNGTSVQALSQNIDPNVAEGLKPVMELLGCALSKLSLQLPSGTSYTPPEVADSRDRTLPQIVNPIVAEAFKIVPNLPEPLRVMLFPLALGIASDADSTSPAVSFILSAISILKDYFLKVSSPHRDATTSGVGGIGDHPLFTSGLCDSESLKSSDNVCSPKPASKTSETFSAEGKAKDLETMKPRLFTNTESCQNFKDASVRPHAGKSLDIIGVSGVKSGVNTPGILETQQGKRDLDARTTVVNGVRKTVTEPHFGNIFPPLTRPMWNDFSGNPIPHRHHEGLSVAPSIYSPYFNIGVDGMGSNVHKNIGCDCCGVLPITGPRFKSTLKHNFDLCSICFAQIGNVTDYIRKDYPWQSWTSLNGSHCIVNSPPSPIQCPSEMKPFTMKRGHSRFDSRFIMDVNVIDGTVMAPSTPFTKVWRMRNNGKLPWSRGLQLTRIGGDQFSASDLVEIEIPACGVPIGKELDIAVDFIAPDLPGQYISYWMMSEPCGQRFGQRVWVLIQVDSYVKDDPIVETSSSLNLNLPPASNGNTSFPYRNVDSSLCGKSGNTPEQSSTISRRKDKIEIGDLNLPINNNLLVDSDTSSSSSSSPRPSLSSSSPSSSPSSFIASSPPIIPSTPAKLPAGMSFRQLKPSMDNNNQQQLYPTVTTVADNNMSKQLFASSLNADSGLMNEAEEVLLGELKEMGFDQVDVNKKVLRLNGYNLEQSLDDLCGVRSEWDPMLAELEEMGFHDKEVNRMLLVKNSGSLMRVVMDLVARRKP